MFLQAGIKDVIWELLATKTKGDKDLLTSLMLMDKTNFFTQELDEALLQKRCDVVIHSAKDMPDPLPEGLTLAHLTESIDPRDVLVYNEETEAPHIGVSSPRRVDAIKTLYPKATYSDIRGTINHRLAQLDNGDFDGVVMAEAALVRLRLNRKRKYLNCEAAPLQGQLALVCREGDTETKQLLEVLRATTAGA